MVQRETDPRDVHGLAPIAHRRDEIPVFERDRTVERLESLARQIKSRLGKVDSVIVHHLRSLERADSRSSVTTSDIQEPKRLDGFVDQNPVQLFISLAVVQKVVIDEFAIKLPLLARRAPFQLARNGGYRP